MFLCSKVLPIEETQHCWRSESKPTNQLLRLAYPTAQTNSLVFRDPFEVGSAHCAMREKGDHEGMINSLKVHKHYINYDSWRFGLFLRR